jgi:hypothetical protein
VRQHQEMNMPRKGLASILTQQIKPLTEFWMAKVREDERITSDEGLSKIELLDHIPSIIQEICELIELGEEPGLKNTHEARASVYTRYHQGYRGSDVIRELALLRRILCDALVNSSSNGSFNLTLDEYVAATRILNSYLDEEMRYAISVYGDSPRPNS